MNVPELNLKFYEENLKSRENAMFYALFDIGSCTLYFVNGSLNTGIDKIPNTREKFSLLLFAFLDKLFKFNTNCFFLEVDLYYASTLLKNNSFRFLVANIIVRL